MKGIEVLKIGTLFSGGLAAVEWAMKYEKFEHEVVFACEWDKFARKQYLAFHGEPSSQFYISVGENPLDLYKPFVWDMEYVKNAQKIKQHTGKTKKDRQIQARISAWRAKFKDIGNRLRYIDGKKEMVNFSNVMTSKYLQKKNYDLDLMVWGSPCQDLSLAGKRKGFDGEKSSLFREGARIMSEVMPKAFIFENVKGLLSSNGGADYKEVEHTFRELGYHMAMKVVNAKEQGTAQNRERVFVVGFLSEDDYHNFSFAESVPLTKCLRDYLEDEVDEKYYLSQKMIDGFIMKNERYEKEGKAKGFTFAPADVDSHSSCLNARYYKMGAADIYIQDEPKLNQVGELDIKGSESLRRVYGTDGICPTMTTMTTMNGGMRQPKVLLNSKEIWKDVRDFEIAYQISNFGKLKRLERMVKFRDKTKLLKEMLISEKLDKDGYLVSKLSLNGKTKYIRINRLVADAFVDNPNNKPEVNHKDGNKQNNLYSNLEWMTSLENQQHRKDVLRKQGSKPNKPRGASWSQEKSKWCSFIKIDGKTEFIEYCDSQEEAYLHYFNRFIEINNYEPWDTNKFPNESILIVKSKTLVLEVGIKSATKSGYEVATENDSINLTHPGSETRRGRVGKSVAQTLDCSCNQGVIVKDVQMGAIRGRNPENPKSRVAGLPTEQMLELNENGTSNCLTSVQKDNVVVEAKILDFTNSFGEDKTREYSDVCPTLRSERHGLATQMQDFRIRRLIPLECGLLMGMRKEDIKIVVSDTQAYKIFGNGIEINSMCSLVRQLYRPVKSVGSLF